MLRRDAFVAAMKGGKWKSLDWTIRAFSVAVAPVPKTGANYEMEDYQLYNDATGHYMAYGGELQHIDDGVPGQPLYRWLDGIELQGDECPNLRGQALTTTYGNLFFNWCVMVYAFGAKLAFQVDKVSPPKIEEQFLPRWIDDPDKEHVQDMSQDSDKDPIYTSEYLRYAEALFFLTSMTQLCVWGATRKTLLPPPGIKEFRSKLLEKNKDHLTELATIAKIDAELVKYDAAYLKGDPGENFLIDKKSRNIVRRKKFLMGGAELGLSQNTVHATLIVNSLHEGWDLTKFPQMNDSLRAGSYSRGAQTMLGGVSVKWLLRASSNINVTQDDCGSKLGSPYLLTPENASKFLGFTLIAGNQQELANSEEVLEKYLGQVVQVRNPMYCKLPYTDYCKTCVGQRLAVNPTGSSIAVSDYGSRMLGMFMSAMHGKTLKTARMDLDQVLS